MDKTILVVGSVTSKQYAPVRLQLHRQEPSSKFKIMRVHDYSDLYPEEDDLLWDNKELLYLSQQLMDEYESDDEPKEFDGDSELAQLIREERDARSLEQLKPVREYVAMKWAELMKRFGNIVAVVITEDEFEHGDWSTTPWYVSTEHAVIHNTPVYLITEDGELVVK